MYIHGNAATVSPWRTVKIDQIDRPEEIRDRSTDAPAPRAGHDVRARPPARKQKDVRPGERLQGALFEDLYRRTP